MEEQKRPTGETSGEEIRNGHGEEDTKKKRRGDQLITAAPHSRPITKIKEKGFESLKKGEFAR